MCPPVCANLSKAIGTRLFWRAPAWSGSDSCRRSLNFKARSFLPKYCRKKISYRLAVRGSSPCKHAQPIWSRAKELLERADVIVYDALANPEMLGWVRVDAEIIFAGKRAGEQTLSQDEINALLIEKSRIGKNVVRLKGGDPFVFGRGGEEAEALAAAGIDFEIVPGITSAIAVPAYAGIPVTHRDQNSHVTFFTGHEDPTKGESAIDFDALARLGGTQVMLMGADRLAAITRKMLAHGSQKNLPVALVHRGTVG